MADQLDRAQEINELHLNLQLKHRKPTLPVTGYCHWCGDIAPADARFCDADCRDDFEQDQRRRG